MKFKNKAFTLAETLVVMGIIGVIAALTVPNLSQSTGNAETLARVKKLYANMNEAIDRAQAIYGPVDRWFADDATTTAQATRFGERVTEFMKLSKNRGFVTSYNGYVITTPDNTTVSFHVFNSDYKISMVLYTPGKGGYGRKIFTLRCQKDSNYYCGPLWYKDLAFSDLVSNLATCMNAASPSNNCAEYGSAWILRYDNMDYLKLKSDGTCSNGKTMTESNPRCN